MKYRIVDDEGLGPYVQYFLGIGRFGNWHDVVLELDEGFVTRFFTTREEATKWISSNAISGSRGDIFYLALVSSFATAILLSIIAIKYLGMSPEEGLAIVMTAFIALLLAFSMGLSWTWRKYASKKEVV
jgi:hypothetical protein